MRWKRVGEKESWNMGIICGLLRRFGVVQSVL